MSTDSDKKYTISRRVRDILLSKPKQLPSLPRPSRLPQPIRQKRSYLEVDTCYSDQTDLDDCLLSPVATSRGARVRQRTDSTSSVATIRHPSKSRELKRTSSMESVQTIPDPAEKEILGSSPIQPDFGSVRTARVILTRSSSHNRVQIENQRTSVETRDFPFPTAKSAPSSPASSSENAMCPNQQPAAKAAPLTRKSSSFMSIDAVRNHDSPARAMPMSASRRLSRRSSSVMSVVSENEPSPPKVSRMPIHAHPSRKFTPSIEENELSLAIDRALEQELEEAETGTRVRGFQDMLASVTRSASERGTKRRSDHPAPRSFEFACSEDPEMKKGWGNGRFDVRLEPEQMLTTVWDAQNTDVLLWSGALAVVDTASTELLAVPQYDYPPIEAIEIELYTIEDAPAVIPPLEPISTDTPTAVKPAHSVPKPDFHIKYNGRSLRRQVAQLSVFDDIVAEPSWSWGYHPASTSQDDGSGHLTYLLHFYAPIPISLFERCEYRQLRLESHLVFGTELSGLSRIHVHPPAVDIAIEHLRKETHMDGTKPLSQIQLGTPSTRLSTSRKN